jgi:hypothetical protein
MPEDWRRDWTNRQAAGTGLVVSAVAVLAGLIARSVGFAIAAALFMAGIAVLLRHWYLQRGAQREAARGHRPEMDPRLELLEETPGLTPPANRPDLSLECLPDHQLSLILRAKAEIDPPALTVDCDAPVYRAFALYQRAGEEAIMIPEPEHRRQTGVLFSFGNQPLPVGTRFLFKIYSPVPIELKRARVAKRAS